VLDEVRTNSIDYARELCGGPTHIDRIEEAKIANRYAIRQYATAIVKQV
jgi:hypothetical protein